MSIMRTSPASRARSLGQRRLFRETRSYAIVVSALLVALVGLSAAGGASAEQPQYPATESVSWSSQPSEEEQQQAEEREVEAVAQGLGITVAAARRAIALTPAVEALRERAVSAHGTSFGGVWRDYGQGGRVKVAFTAEANPRAAQAARGFPAPEVVDGVGVAFSLGNLEALNARITTELPDLRAQGIDVNTVGVNVEKNVVRLGVKSLDESDKAELSKRYGAERLEIVEQAAPVAAVCERYACEAFPLRAGLILDFPTSSCSSAFSAYRGGQGGVAGVFSAGHCAAINSGVLHNNHLLGAVAWKQFSGRVDGLWIDKIDTWPRNENWVWQESWDRGYTITSRIGYAGGNVGDPICHSGYRRGYRCGKITRLNVTVNVQDGPTLTEQREDNICTGPGDSGGPVYANHKAHGIISTTNSHINNDGSYRCSTVDLDGVGPRTYYPSIRRVEDAFSVLVQTW
jgi:streptogrisin C